MADTPSPGPHDGRKMYGDYDPVKMEECERHESPLDRGRAIFEGHRSHSEYKGGPSGDEPTDGK